MDLQISALRLVDFRSYASFRLGDLGPLTIFVGPNGVGKSNLLEAIQLATALSSFRSATSEQLIRWGADQARIDVHLGSDQRELDVSVLIGPHGRRYRLNGKAVQGATVQENLPAVAFSPDDLQLVKGAPSARRAALDALGAQLSANYRAVKRDYDKILRQKNALLKSEADAFYLESVNEVLAVVGAQLIRYRLHIFHELEREFPVQYRQATESDERAALTYRLSWEPDAAGGVRAAVGVPPEDDAAASSGAASGGVDADELPSRAVLQQRLTQALADLLQEERARKRALVGPHRDTLDFVLNGHAAQHFASQGQQRSLAIAFKLAEFSLIARKRKQKPVLLLDDVMSEIDATRRAGLMRWIGQATQTFITTANLEYFSVDMLSDARVIHLPQQTG